MDTWNLIILPPATSIYIELHCEIHSSTVLHPDKTVLLCSESLPKNKERAVQKYLKFFDLGGSCLKKLQDFNQSSSHYVSN